MTYVLYEVRPTEVLLIDTFSNRKDAEREASRLNKNIYTEFSYCVKAKEAL